MRISEGLSLFSLPSAVSSQPKSTMMVWPVYDDTRITPIKGIARRLENNVQYVKPTPDEHARLLSQIHDNKEPLYTNNAFIQKNMQYTIPGTFFDAIA